MEQAKNIEQAIAEVYSEVGYVQKTKKDGGLKYAYAGETALIEALRPAMQAQGVTVSCVSADNIKRERVAMQKNGYENNQYFTTGVFTYRFTHAPSQTHIDVVALGEGYDSLDKGAYKAMTGALKYALRQTFLIETGDDPDKYQGNGIDDRTEEQKKADERAAKERSVENLIANIEAVKSVADLDAGLAKAAANLDTLKAVYPDLRDQVDEAAHKKRMDLGVNPAGYDSDPADFDGEHYA